MRVIASAASILLLLGAAASAQTLDDLKNDGKNTDNILTYGMGYHQQRHSPLKQINKQTVKRLVPVWNLSLDNNWGEQAQPIVYNGVMYVTNARHTVAIDVAHRQADLEAYARLAGGDPARRLLRRLQQGRGDLQRQDLSAPRSTPICSRSTPRPARSCGSRRSPSGRTASRSRWRRWSPTASWSSAIPAPSSACAAGSTAGIPRPASSCGAATPFRRAARRATRPGRRTTTPGSSAAARPGSPARTIPSST